MPSNWVIARDWFTEGIAFLAKFIAPIAVVAASVLGMPPGIANILKAIPALMAAAELALPEKGSGPSKKKQVLDSAQAFLVVAEKNFTGGAKVNFDQLKPLIEAIIDNGIAAINATMPEIIADDPPAVPVVDPTQAGP
jgi:hypothetical protein